MKAFKLTILFVPILIVSQFAQQDIKEKILNVEDLLKSQSQELPKLVNDMPTEEEIFTMPTEPFISTQKDTQEVNYFGYDFFQSRQKISIFDNLPVPEDYQLGPGDEIVISLWGDAQIRSAYLINKNGELFIDKIGLVNLSGMNISQSKAHLQKKFERVYSTLQSPDPTTFFDLSLGRLKSINVTFLGESEMPGIHAVHPFSTITTALIQTGGVKTTGSLRDVQIIRNGKVVAKLDLYEFLIHGVTQSDIRIHDKDVIFIPLRKSTITLEGSVNRPGIYESKLKETLQDIIMFAGGFVYNAQSKIQIKRTIPIKDRTDDDNALEIKYIPISDCGSFVAVDGDIVTAHEIFQESRFVHVLGQVKSPGKYAFEDSMRVLDLLKLAGGLYDESFWKTIHTIRAELIRPQSDSEYPKIFEIDLRKLKDGINSENICLQNWDVLLIRSNSKYQSPKKVTVTGEVNVPGIYTIREENETLANLIKRTGGFTNFAFVEGVKMYRDGNQVVLRDYDISVLDGDNLHIPVHPGVVQVVGEVYKPGFVQYKKGASLNYYIERAGGRTLFAEKKGTIVIYANGDIKIKKWFSPEVKEGSTIIVNTAEIKEPFDITEFLKETASIAASTATIFYIITK